MSATLVIDCSVTMSWCFADEATPETAAVQDRLISDIALVPAHWALEVANVLAMAERRQRISASEVTEFLALLAVLPIEFDSETSLRTFNDILHLARAHGLTVYDAAYLKLALRRQLPLASLDHELCKVASTVGVPLLV